MTDTRRGVAFETLIYTDCRPGQGLQGTAGLQFQACSPGADREAMAVVQRNLLYEPPSSWMREKRPVEEYPPSFAHVHDGVYVTAAGIYCGREANGGREGNQLTHSIVARDAAAYGLVRPAQLFRAPFWTTRPADSTSCPAVGEGWEPGPLDAGSAQDSVLAYPRGADLLLALVSALDLVGGADGQRILFIAEDPEAVLRWLVAGTLLIPQQRALSIGLKVFTTNPAYAAQPVIAVHPGWDSTSVTVDNDSGYAVFDLVAGDWSKVDPTPEAVMRVRLFCEHDPYDVVDLVEIASGTGAEPCDALELGRAMVLPGAELTERSANLAVEWLRSTDPRLLAAHRGDLVDQLTAAVERWPLQILRSLDEVALKGQVPADHMPAVRLALIRAELEAAVRDHRVVDTPLPPLPEGSWSESHQHTAEVRVAEVLTRELPATAVDAALRIAFRFGLAVRPAQVPEALRTLVTDWADGPPGAYDAGCWPCGPMLEQMLLDELDARVVAGEGTRVGDDWWQRLAPRIDAIDSPLAGAVAGAALVHAADDEQQRVVLRVVSSAACGPDPGSAVPAAVAALWRRRRPYREELGLLGELLPDGPALPGWVFESLSRELLDESRLTRAALNLAHELVGCSLFRPGAPVRRLLDSDRDLDTVCESLPRVASDDEFRRCVGAVRRADPRLVEVWGKRLVRSLLEVEQPYRVSVLLTALPAEIGQGYRDRLLAAVRKPGRPGHVCVAFYLSLHPKVTDRTELTEQVVWWIARSSPRQQRPVQQLVAELGGEWPERWTEFQELAKHVRPRWWLPRRQGGE